ncbi:MAG: PPC domain-containing DNA-binding protein [Syntrophobacteraceae bacterium]
MQYDEGSLGRIFTLRLEQGDRLPQTIEDFAIEHNIRSAMAIYIGGAEAGSRLVVGPEQNRGDEVVPITHALQGIHEVLAVGTLFTDEAGKPVLHMHAAAGREGGAVVGCTRAGVDVWLVGEVILFEILGTSGRRENDPRTGFQLLQFGGAS